MARYDTRWQSGRRRPGRIRWTRLGACLGGAVLALVLAWAVLFSPLLRVRAIQVSGAAHVDEAEVIDAARSVRTGFFKRALSLDHLLGWPTELPAEVVSLVPGAESISVDRAFFSGIVTLRVVEREPTGVWCFEGDPSGQVCQWFDEHGIVYSRAYVSQGSLVAVVHDKSQAKAGEGRRVLPEDQLQNFLAILSVLHARGISPRQVELPSLAQAEVTMTTYNGPRLLFTLRVPPDQVPPVLDDFIKQGTFNGLSYIDFRSAKRAFYQ